MLVLCASRRHRGNESSQPLERYHLFSVNPSSRLDCRRKREKDLWAFLILHLFIHGPFNSPAPHYWRTDLKRLVLQFLPPNLSLFLFFGAFADLTTHAVLTCSHALSGFSLPFATVDKSMLRRFLCSCSGGAASPLRSSPSKKSVVFLGSPQVLLPAYCLTVAYSHVLGQASSLPVSIEFKFWETEQPV